MTDQLARIAQIYYGRVAEAIFIGFVPNHDFEDMRGAGEWEAEDYV